MRLTTDELPRIERLAGVSLEIDGTPTNYRDADDLLEIGGTRVRRAGPHPRPVGRDGPER
jgi:hypothetical protein